MRRIVGFLLVAFVGASILPAVARSEPNGERPLARLSAGVPARATGALDLVLTLDRPASSKVLSRLAALGAWAWAARHIAVAAVRIPPGRIDDLRRVEGVVAVHPNRSLTLFDRPSTGSPPPAVPGLAPEAGFGAAVPVPGLGVTGRGVTVAIVDSGIDFTHPDLAPAMVANVKFHATGLSAPAPPVEGLPNTDTTSGHGTHVAGDAAGRGIVSGGTYQGAAPGASLVGVAVGEGLHVSSLAVVQGYDWILEHRRQHWIRVVNNSYGTAEFEPFDPDDPVNTATRAAADAGLVVVFAQGNRGDELTMNSYGAAPWVIPVAAGTRAGGVTDFSSGGVDADVLGDCFECSVAGDPRRPLNMGSYHPAVVGLGENVVGPRTSPTIVPFFGARRDVALPPGQQAWYTIQSGTSVASPEVAGIVALILEANPALTPADVRQILQVTARPVPGVPFFRQGYGSADTAGAVGLARALAGKQAEVRDSLDRRQAARDREVLAGLSRALTTSGRAGFWPFGVSSHAFFVDPGAGRLKVVASGFASPNEPLPTLTIVVRDPTGREVARSAPRSPGSSPATILDIDLTGRSDVVRGHWSVEIDDVHPSLNGLVTSTAVVMAATFAQPETPQPVFNSLPRPSAPPR